MYFIVDRMGGMAIRWAYNHSATDAKLKTIVEKIEVEIVLMGSSKTEDHFIPQVFEDSLGMSTYNCGLVGYIISMHCLILCWNAILQR